VNPFSFGGAVGYYDDDALLVYVRDRYYAPPLGRWISRDRLGLGAEAGTCTGTWGMRRLRLTTRCTFGYDAYTVRY
jgi:RHS repeat-associated protein